MRELEFLKNLTTSICCILVVTTLANASPEPEGGFPLPPDPLVTSTLVGKFIHITHPGCSVDANTTVDLALVTALSDSLQNFMNDQAIGTYTFSVSTIVDDFSSPASYSWEADHTTDYYLAHCDSMPFNQAGAASGATGEVNAEIAMKIIDKYELEGEPNPFLDADYVFFIFGCQMWDDWYAGIARTNLHGTYWVTGDTILMKSVKGFYTSRDHDNANLLETLNTISAHEFGHNLALHHPSHANHDTTLSYGAYDKMRTPLLHTWTDTVPGMFSFSAMNKYDAGWLDASDVEEETLGLILYDSQTADRNTIVVPLEGCGGQFDNERFILSYHSQRGYDSRHASTGLQIWHSLKGEFNDIEAASGRWSLNDLTISDPVYGVDKLDLAYHEAAGWQYFSEYHFYYAIPGFEGDFFNVNDTTVYPDGAEFGKATLFL